MAATNVVAGLKDAVKPLKLEVVGALQGQQADSDTKSTPPTRKAQAAPTRAQVQKVTYCAS
jgi:hypothetical protein